MRTRTTALTSLSGALTVACAAIALLAPSLASAATPAAHWVTMLTSGPTYFKAGDVGDYYEAIAVNDGGAGTDGSDISLVDILPAGVTATAISGDTGTAELNNRERMTCSTTTVSCHIAIGIQPGEVVRVKVVITVAPGVSGSLTNHVEITGGGTEPAHATSSTPISSEAVPFGASLVSHVASEDGANNTQAGSHPFGFTSILAFNVASASRVEECEPGPILGCAELSFNPKDLSVALPAGLVGDPLAVPRCSQITFQSYLNNNCPANTQVGALQVYFYGTQTSQYAPVYNVEPPPGQPAELGFTVGGFFHIPMFFHVRSNGDYGLTANLEGISEVEPVRMGVLTMWGVPGAGSRDSQRSGSGCPTGCASGAGTRPFLTLPTRCTEEELAVGFSGDSWQHPGAFFSEPPTHIPGITGCEALSFAPSLEVHPDVAATETPSGYSVNLKVPQTETQETLATPSLRDAVVTLPSGTVISASAANGLQACSEAHLGINGEAAAECPRQSNIGEVEVVTPLLEKPLHGSVYVAQPKCGGEGQPACTQASATNGELYGLYLVVEGYGIVIKLKGTVSANPMTGQLTATFKENPQLPFSELNVRLRGGAAAPLANPQNCGTSFTTTSDLTPWSAPATPDATPSSTFQLTGCANPVPFAPTFSAGTLVPNATGSSPLTLAVGRHDGEQYLSGITTTLPPGLLGMLAQVPLCEEPQAAAGACSESSRIGTTSVAAGSGPYPFWLSGKVFLTGPYHGAPFGLSIVVPTNAGPFNLGNEIVRARITVNPATTAVTVTSEPLPQMKDGIPTRLQNIDVTIDRAGFILNPSNCEQHAITGTISGAQGAVESVSSPFAVEGCGYLSFKPHFTASTKGKTSKRNGASLDVKVTLPTGHEANIHSVKVALPLSLPSRLSTLQRACTAAVFDANPANCPPESAVGVVHARTPVLPAVLSGPAYLVSHGGEAFPNLVLVLQGDGVTVDLTGTTDIKKGITTSTFHSLPDVPVTSFALHLPEGRFSVLAANGNLCKQQLRMPTQITGQNGTVVKQTTKISVTGCPKVKAKKVTKRHKAKKGHKAKGSAKRGRSVS
jgi:hypothetical protein